MMRLRIDCFLALAGALVGVSPAFGQDITITSGTQTFTGLTYADTMTVGPGAAAEFEAGLVLNGGTLINNGGLLDFVPPLPKSLTGTGTVTFGVTDTNDVDSYLRVDHIGSGITIETGPAFSGVYPEAHISGSGSVVDTNLDLDATVNVTGGMVYVASSGITDTADATFNLSGGGLRVSGDYTTAQIGTLNQTGGDFWLAGDIDNAGQTLVVPDNPGTFRLNGWITGGNLNNTNGSTLLVAGAGAILEDVTSRTNIRVVDGAELDIRGSTNFDTAQVIELVDDSQLYFRNTANHIDNLILDFGPATTHSDIRIASDAPLTFGPNTVISTNGGDGEIVTFPTANTDPWYNQGTIQATEAGRTITLARHVINTGTFRAINGGMIHLTGQYDSNSLNNHDLDATGRLILSGQWDGIGQTFTVDGAGKTVVLGYSSFLTQTGGRVEALNGAKFAIEKSGLQSPNTGDEGIADFTGTTLAGLFDIGLRGRLELTAVTLDGATIDVDASDQTLDYEEAVLTLKGPVGSTTDLAGTGTINLKDYGHIQLRDGDSSSGPVSGDIRIASGITIQGGGTDSGIQYHVHGINGYTPPHRPVLINQGQINANQSGKTLRIEVDWINQGTMTATNAGRLRVSAGTNQGTLRATDGKLRADGDLTNDTGGVLQGLGTLDFRGTHTLINHGRIELGDGTVPTAFSLTPTHDASAISSLPDTVLEPFGVNGLGEAGGDTRIFLTFDLSSLPPGTTILGTPTLTLTGSGTDLGGSVSGTPTIEVVQLTSAFNEDAATWNDRDTGTPWTTPGGDLGTSLASLTGPDPSTFGAGDTMVFSGAALTSDLQAALGAGAYGLAVKFADESGTARSVFLTATDETGGNNAPRLDLVVAGLDTTVLHIDGHFDQAADGTLAIDLAGLTPGTHDQLAITGNAALDGTIEIDLAPGFTPDASDTFTVLTADSITGNFAGVTGDRIDGYTPYVATVVSNAVVLRLAEAGDADGDGQVGMSDLESLASHWTQSATQWEQADFNQDGVVDALDLDIMRLAWGSGAPAAPVSFDDAVDAMTFVPEPSAAAALLGFVCFAVTRRRA